MTASSPHIKIRDEGAIRRIELARPEKANAMNAGMMRAISSAVATAASDGMSMVVLGGRFARGFTSGADISEIAKGEAHLHEQEAALLDMIGSIARLAIPFAAVIRGYTLGGGCILTSLSDIVIASDDLQFGLPEIGFNMFPAIPYGVLMHKVTAPIAAQLCLTGRLLDATEAQRMGLVSDVLPAEGFDEAAEARLAFYVDRLAALSIGKRAMRMTTPHEELDRRLEALAPLLRANYELPGVRDRVGAVLARATR